MLDEDSQGRILVRRLREAGHDVLTVREAGLDAHSDAEVLAHARHVQRVLLTRNVRDFLMLHTADPAHSGILGEHQDRELEKNMTESDIVQAIDNLDKSGWNLEGQFAAHNAWNYAAPGE